MPRRITRPAVVLKIDSDPRCQGFKTAGSFAKLSWPSLPFEGETLRVQFFQVWFFVLFLC